jgi:hypothetical protein
MNYPVECETGTYQSPDGARGSGGLTTRKIMDSMLGRILL